jgi:hypothetical protein
MNNIVLRNSPRPAIRGLARIEAIRLSVVKLFRGNLSAIFSALGWTLAGVGIVGVIALAVYIPVHSSNTNILKAAQKYHYKAGQQIYCDHGQDSTNTPNASWTPCTVVSVENPQYTRYFVNYGTVQAFINPEHMHRTAATP